MSTSPTTVNIVATASPSTAASGVVAAQVGVQPLIAPPGSPVAIQRLPDSQFPFAFGQQSFLSTVSDTVGNFGDPSDGFDDLLSVPLGSLDGDLSSLPGLLSDLADADFVDGAFDAGTLAPIASSIGDFTAQGDTLLNTFQTNATPAQPPAQPPTQPPGQPPKGGGGGGGSPDPQPIGQPCSDLDCDPFANPDRPL